MKLTIRRRVHGLLPVSEGAARCDRVAELREEVLLLAAELFHGCAFPQYVGDLGEQNACTVDFFLSHCLVAGLAEKKNRGVS